MGFVANAYGSAVAEILALDGNGQRRMPLAMGTCSSPEAARHLRDSSPGSLLPGSSRAEAAYSGLWLYFSCLDESHQVSQGIRTEDGSFWHAIMHRQEPDAGNSAYWFRHAGRHPVFGVLRNEAKRLSVESPEVGFSVGEEWNPFDFIDFCEHARQRPGSAEEALALDIQRAEWQILFDYCARP